MNSASIGVIGGADGPTAIFVTTVHLTRAVLAPMLECIALMLVLYFLLYRRGRAKPLCCVLSMLGIVAADQMAKLAVLSLDLGETAPFLPPLVQLRRVHNYGAAWSSLSGARWLLIAATAIGMGALIWLLVKIVRHPLGVWSLTMVIGGGIGNLIDRAARGYVVDMFDLMFMNYPVFNVADCFVVVGTVLAVIYYLKYYAESDAGIGRNKMEKALLRTTESEKGMRLDAYLASALDELTRSAAAKLISDGQVTVDGRTAGKSLKLSGGETVEVTLPEPEAIDAVAQDIPLDVVYEDSDVIVVNKPAGLVVHPAPGHPDGTLVNALLYHCGDSLSGIGGALRPGIVHRIDRDTSGLIIAAKNDAAHQALTAQLSDHTLGRTYECIVTGNLREDRGTVDAPIARHPTDRKKMAVVAGGRNAVTHWEVIAHYPGYTYVRCRLETGRTHQIRVHMAYIGHPILGDTVYGNKKSVPGLTGQCLHAVGLQFLHPRTGELVQLSCPLPEEFTGMLRKIDK